MTAAEQAATQESENGIEKSPSLLNQADTGAEASGAAKTGGGEGGQEAANDERPAWLPEKFKTPEDLAKSYGELEKTLREKGKVAPEKYDVKVEGLDPADPTLNGFLDMAKKSNWSQSQVELALNFARENGMIGPLTNPAEEMKQLGADAKQIVETVSSFATSKLTKDEQAVFSSWVTTAAEARLMNKLVGMYAPKNMPRGEATPQKTMAAMDAELGSIISNPNYGKDEALQHRALELSAEISKLK